MAKFVFIGFGFTMVGDKIIASDVYQLWSGVIKPSGLLAIIANFITPSLSILIRQINDDDENCFQTSEMSLCYKIIIEHLDISWQT